jgi:hypothetical protein
MKSLDAIVVAVLLLIAAAFALGVVTGNLRYSPVDQAYMLDRAGDCL